MPQGQWVAFDISTEESHVCGVKNEPDVSVKLKGKKKFKIKNNNIKKEITGKDDSGEIKTYESVSGIHKCIDIAIKEKKRILIEYNSKYNEEFTKREISPIKKFKQENKTYLQAFCHKRKAERIFITRSIISASKVDKQRTKIKLDKPNLKIIKKFDGKYNSQGYFEKPKQKIYKKEIYEPSTKRKINLREEIEGMFELILTLSIISGLVYVFFFN